MNNKINIPEYFVSEFNKYFREVIDLNFDYMRIRGEISEIKTATKGQLYLTLKDNDSILSGVIWSTKLNYIQFKPELGMEVVVTGKITTWHRYKTTYQIDIDKIELAGQGALLKLIADRKKRLKERGLFDEKNKKKIPFLPNKIGVITSPTGSVIHDIINRLQERFPIKVEVWPVSVQGSESASSIVQAIEGFNHTSYKEKPDVLIIARGGGAPEDLMSFNDENLAFAVFKSNIPIISAVGHETDTTIIDFVSDLRAATPTAAAEIVVPMRTELKQNLSNTVKKLSYLVDNNFNHYKNNLLNISKFLKAPSFVINSFKDKSKIIFSSLIKEFQFIIEKKINRIENISKYISPPENLFNSKKNRIKDLKVNLYKNINNINNNKRNEFNKLNRLLDSNSINNNLKKGYVIINKSKKIIKRSSQLTKKENVEIKFYDKAISANIKKTS